MTFINNSFIFNLFTLFIRNLTNLELSLYKQKGKWFSFKITRK